jgi:hypothetical protein
MELQDTTASETERREEEAFLEYLEKAGELTRGWPEWKRSVIRSWPNGAGAAETRKATEPEAKSQEAKSQDTERGCKE